jgi:sulfur carrier protein ThiS
MTADIGAHHNRAWTITMDEDLGKNVIAGKAKVVVYLQHIRPFFDTVSCCRLFWGEVDVTAEEHIAAIQMMTGWNDFTLEEAMRLSDRLWNLNRAHFLERNGCPGRKFDYPNARFYEEAVPTGPSKGARLTLEDLDVMLDEYYVARGWGKDGNPSREVLLDLGLDACVANLERGDARPDGAAAAGARRAIQAEGVLTMTVLLKAGGMLTDYLRPDVDAYTRRVERPGGATLREILESIGVPPGHVAMAFANGGLITLGYVPSDGDVITLRPPVQGG